MQRFKNNGLARILAGALLAAAALAQTASEKPSVDVRRVGARIACQCGCKDSVSTCSMLECHFSKPAKERIAQMVLQRYEVLPFAAGRVGVSTERVGGFGSTGH